MKKAPITNQGGRSEPRLTAQWHSNLRAFMDTLGYLIGRAHYSMRRRLNRRISRMGLDLSGEQGLVLLMLGVHSEVNQQDLADRMFKDKTGISRLVSSMEQKGLILRTSTIADRRNNYLQLTDEGHKVLDSMKTQISEIQDEAWEGVSEKELDICGRVLQRVIDNLNECDGPMDEG